MEQFSDDTHKSSFNGRERSKASKTNPAIYTNGEYVEFISDWKRKSAYSCPVDVNDVYGSPIFLVL